MGVSLQTSEKKQVQTCPNLSRSEQAMRRFCLGLLMALCLASPIKAWGGLFNRFNPSLMPDVYGAGSYGKQLYSAADGGKVNQNLAEIIEEELEAEAKDPCNGRTCTMNEQCCNWHVCVDTDDTMGTCLPVYGKKQGEQCFNPSAPIRASKPIDAAIPASPTTPALISSMNPPTRRNPSAAFRSISNSFLNPSYKKLNWTVKTH